VAPVSIQRVNRNGEGVRGIVTVQKWMPAFAGMTNEGEGVRGVETVQKRITGIHHDV